MNKDFPVKLLRLNASPYQGDSFFSAEEKMAKSLGLDYELFLNENKKEQTLAHYILISNTHTEPAKVPHSILQKTLFWLHSNSGYDNFSPEWLLKQKFPIFTGNSIRKEAVLEYILAHLFQHYGFHPKQGLWSKERLWNRDLLSDKKVLILGKGLIGCAAGEILSPLVKQVTYYDPFVKETPDTMTTNLSALLKENQIFILAASLNPTSYHLLSTDEFNQMCDNYLLINAARGKLCDQKALIKSLEEKPQAFAYLDVFEEEPYQDEFSVLKNVHITSHIAGVFSQLGDKIIQYERNIISEYLTHGEAFLEKKYSSLNLKNRIRKDYLI